MISILMPVKNAVPYLRDCLDSIRAQTLANWELIAVNDHSTDGSADILDVYAQKDERIQLYENTGDGIIDALSLAFEQCNGTRISRMDADDVMMPEKLELMAKELKQNPGCVVTSYVEYFAEGELGAGYINYENWLNRLIDEDSHYEHIYKECVLPSPNWIAEKDLLERVGGFQNLEYPEDYDLAFKLYKQGIPLVGIEKVLHKWRDYPGRTSRHDPNYQDNTFVPLKVKHFLKIDFKTDTPLILWGSGRKGKSIAKRLKKRAVPFVWITNNQRKIGSDIYGIPLDNDHLGNIPENSQLIIAVAGPVDQTNIQERLESRPDLDVYWFC